MKNLITDDEIEQMIAEADRLPDDFHAGRESVRTEVCFHEGSRIIYSVMNDGVILPFFRMVKQIG